MHPTPYIPQEEAPMAIAKIRSSSDEDFVKVGPDATATFDNSSSNPTEHASSESLSAIHADEDELDDEDLDEDDEEYDDDEDEDEDEDEEEEEDDHYQASGPKASSFYRKL
jgi:hypothetical protein